jgi:adenylate cyclase
LCSIIEGVALDLSSADADFNGPSERRLRAMVHADVAGYSHLIGMNDAGTVRRLRTLRRALIDPAIRAFHGRIVNTAGDSMMIMFDSVDTAVQCALRVQQQVPVLDGDHPPERRIRFRVGINIGDVIAEGTDVHGDGSNIAARLQSICPVGGICVSRAVRDHVHARLGLEFEPLGPQTLKNITQPVEAFALRLDPGAPTRARVARRRPWKPVLAGVVALLLGAGVGVVWWLDGPKPVTEAPPIPAPSTSAFPPPNVGLSRAPRLSLVVLPFDNLDSTPEQNSLVDGITEDLTTALAQKWGLVVTARNSAFTYKGKAIDIKRVGNELGVRYALEGSVRKVGTTLRVNAQLVSTETGAHLWAYQVDADVTAGPDQDEFIWRISTELVRELIDIERARGARERPGNPDAMDILLQAQALYTRPSNQQSMSAMIALFERAVQLDPTSAQALTGLATALLDNVARFSDDPTAPATFDRAEALIAKAEALEPRTASVMYARGYLLRSQQRWPEAIATFQTLINNYPSFATGYHLLGTSLLYTGRTAEALLNEQRSIQLDPRNPGIAARYQRIGQASLILGRYDEAVLWEQRSLAALRDSDAHHRAFRYVEIAAAHAFAGRIEEARAAAAEVSRLWPTMTARGWWGSSVANPLFAAQLARVEDGLRIAGLRDHADEDADFGVASDDALPMKDEARTPTRAPGVQTIRTTDLATFLEERKPLILDVNAWGKSIPGAIRLRGAGIGGTTSDPVQTRLDHKMQELTHGDRSIPIVTIAWNADRFSGRNLALRLAALGYTNVMWYRGGREAWEVAGLPETEVVVQEW